MGGGQLFATPHLANWGTAIGGSPETDDGSEILIGTGILVVGLALVKALGDWETERSPDPELA